MRIFTADIIYHLFDQFTAYMKEIKSAEQEAARFKVGLGGAGKDRGGEQAGQHKSYRRQRPCARFALGSPH